MSRIGKHPISIPAGVTVSVKDGVVTVKGPKGELTQSVDARIEVAVEDAQVVVRRNSDERQERSLHGLYRALTDQLKRLGETFGDTDDHVVDEGTIEAVQ